MTIVLLLAPLVLALLGALLPERSMRLLVQDNQVDSAVIGNWDEGGEAAA